MSLPADCEDWSRTSGLVPGLLRFVLETAAIVHAAVIDNASTMPIQK
jgi:hypothetical protein